MSSRPSPEAEQDPVRRALRAAAYRIVDRCPHVIEVGNETGVGLANEAGVLRHWVAGRTGRHRDIYDEMVRLLGAREHGGMSRLESELSDALEAMKAERDELKEEVRVWMDATHDFKRIVQIQMAQEQLLRSEIASLKDIVAGEGKVVPGPGLVDSPRAVAREDPQLGGYTPETTKS